MIFLLRSPLHGLWSDSLMLITFKGRKSGKNFTTPVRYIQTDGTVRCFTGSENQWWRNLRGGANVVLRIRGKDRPYKAVAIDTNPEEVKKWLAYYLELFPQDAAYHDIKLNKDKAPLEGDLERASHEAIAVVADLPGGSHGDDD
ncbi:MAG: nitroreductase family deazaflavin-dependent oxidoreductase [Gammaproteobacteria bacterium]|nr:hypothetical protein [Chromatiales bacterium]MCP4925132.1 nitroreductase family deazaflavin-dependent oxidoreductase [Gammaproteobacteria bacterium]